MEVAALGLKVEGVSSIDQATKSLDNFTNASEKAEKSTDGLSKSTKSGSSSFQQMAAVAGRLAGILGGALLSGGLVRLADTWSDLSSRVRVVIGETGNVADVMRQLSDVARTTYSSLESTADSFARNAFTLNALGKSTQEQIDFTAALNNALVVSGAKGAQFNMVQNSLNRAMAEGTLRGQELQNVLNYGSEVAQSLATELGVNVTELRALAAEGKITGEVIYQSLIKRQEELHNLAETMPATVGDAFIIVRNNILQLIGEFDQAANVSGTLAEKIIDIADAAKQLTEGDRILYWAKALQDDLAEMSHFFTVLGKQIGAVAAILATGFKVGGLNNIRSILQALNEDLIELEIRRALDEQTRQTVTLERAVERLIDDFDLFGFTVEESASNGSAAIKKLSDEAQRLLDKLYPLKARARELSAELGILRQAAKDGLIDPSALDDWYEKNLMIATSIREEVVPEVENLAAQADPLAESWQEALNRIDSAFVDLWKSAFSGFKDFADSLKNAFIQLLAELAHRATTQKILVGLGFTAGSGGAMAAGSSQSAGILSGITTAASNLGGGILGVLSGIGKTIPALQGAVSGLSSILVSTGTKIAGLFGATGLSANIAALVGTGGIGAAIAGITAIVSRLSASWETTRGGIRLGFEGSEFSPDEWIRQTKKSLGGTKRRYRFSDLDPEIAAALNETYGSIVSEAQSAFAILGADLAEEFFESIQIGEVLIGTSGKSKQTEEEIQRQIEQWFAQLQDAMIQGALNAAGDQSAALRLLKASGGGQIMLQALGNLLSVAGVNAAQMARDSHVQLTISEGYDRISQSTRQLIAEYDGSVEATNALTEAMALQQEAAFQVASAFLQAKDAAAQLFGNLRESIRTSLMGQEELYEYRRGQVHSLTDLISTLTDPEAILRASQQIEQTVSALWSSLDETQRKLLGDEYLEYLDRTEQLVMDRLNKGLEEVETTQADIFSALTDQMGTIADRMIEATEAMQAAAELNYLAAQNFNASVGLLMSGFNGGGYYMQEQNA